LCDNIYAKATIVPTNDRVCLWLGVCIYLNNLPPLTHSSQANVMLEYSYEEAIEMLTKNRGQAVLKLVGQP
jgi:hypothetical protein